MVTIDSNILNKFQTEAKKGSNITKEALERRLTAMAMICPYWEKIATTVVGCGTFRFKYDDNGNVLNLWWSDRPEGKKIINETMSDGYCSWEKKNHIPNSKALNDTYAQLGLNRAGTKIVA